MKKFDFDSFFRLLPHASIIISLMMLTFYFIDVVNKAMGFIDNDMTKTLLMVYSFLNILICIVVIAKDRNSR